MTFSQRIGLIKVRDAIQVDSLDTETRVALWNVISPYLCATQHAIESTTIQEIWTEVFQTNRLSQPQARLDHIRDDFKEVLCGVLVASAAKKPSTNARASSYSLILNQHSFSLALSTPYAHMLDLML